MGSKGSGNWGHKGRKGKKGGSLPTKGGLKLGDAAKSSDDVLEYESKKLQTEYQTARMQNNWIKVGEIEPLLEEVNEKMKLRHFAKMDWQPKKMGKRAWKEWKSKRGL